MDIRPAFQLQTVIKAMTDVILPAVDPNNKLAQEQAGLVIAILNLIAQRMPLIYRYEREELTRFLELAGQLHKHAKDFPGTEAVLHSLSDTMDEGSDVLDRARADPKELEAANFAMRERIGHLITTIYSQMGPVQLKPINELVLAHAKEQLIRERSWLIAQGWEADPSSIPPVETLLSNVE